MAALPNVSSDWGIVGRGLSVRFSIAGAGTIEAEWLPRRPKDKAEFLQVRDRYRAARNEYLVELAKRTGRQMVLVEF